MRRILNITFSLIGGFFLLAVSMQSLAVPIVQEELNMSGLVSEAQSSIEKEVLPDINDMPFQDNMDIYQYDDPGSVVTMYITVRMGNLSDKTNHTWQEVNASTNFFTETLTIQEVAKAEVIFQIGDENGPIPGELGYGELVPNATIQIRGNSTSRMPQKSYKIEFRDRAGEWRGQTTLALNKHIFDVIRSRNKLSFDLMKEIPHLVSLRTQFVHLYVKDETSDPPGKVFVDYGLFTQIEQPNRTFLQNHLLDRDGQLYKPTNFEFRRYPDKIRLADDPLYDEDVFSTVLEIKGNRDHSKLIQMLDDVNNQLIPIEQSFEKYFDADNYFSWLAFNILIGHLDTQSQNYYLYSPQNSEKWYFIPWDYDGALRRQDSELRGRNLPAYFEKGITTYWGTALHERVLRVDIYRQMLDEKIKVLLPYLSHDRIKRMLDIYKPITDKYIDQMPDVMYARASKEDYDLIYSTLPNEVQLNYHLYIESLEVLMPFHLGVPQAKDDKLDFNWSDSYDLEGEDITYHFMISKDWDFNDNIVDEKTTRFTNVQIALLEPGTYFWRVEATNEDGILQYAFDRFRDAEGDDHFGMKILYITVDGQILEE